MFRYLCFMICLSFVLSCSSGEKKRGANKNESTGIDVRIIKQMGQLPSDTISYLPLIGNMAEVKSDDGELLHLVIGKGLENGDNVEVKELSTLVFQHGNEIHKLILSVPLDEEHQSIEVENFNDLATKYGSVKWAIESWYNHFAGLGRSKFLRWENLNYD